MTIFVVGSIILLFLGILIILINLESFLESSQDSTVFESISALPLSLLCDFDMESFSSVTCASVGDMCTIVPTSLATFIPQMYAHFTVTAAEFAIENREALIKAYFTFGLWPQIVTYQVITGMTGPFADRAGDAVFSFLENVAGALVPL